MKIATFNINSIRGRLPNLLGWLSLRIDHLLLSPELVERLVNAGVDKQVRGRSGASDHAPAWIEVATKTRRRAKRGARSKQK